MDLDISQMAVNTTVPFCFSEEKKNAEGYPDIVKFLAPVAMEGALTRLEEMYVLEAKVNTEVEILCSRCLAPVNVKLNFKLNEKFSNTGNTENEIEALDGDILVLDEYVRRSMFGAVPLKVLCKEDCKGFCPICGKNLNEGQCDCDTSYVNPAFESLRSLFKADEEV